MVNVFFATGYEEIEALTVVDLLRRAGIKTNMVSVTGDLKVTGSHGIEVTMDKLFEDIDDSATILVLPGGMPGTLNLKAHKGLAEMIKRYDADENKYIAAICAAPTVFGEMGLLAGKKATCYPGMEDGLLDAIKSMDSVCIDGKTITSRGMGTAIDFGLTLIAVLKDDATAKDMANKIVYGN